MTGIDNRTTWSPVNKTGLILTVVYAVLNLPTVLLPGPEDGETGPPLVISIGCTVFSAIAIVAGILAWTRGSRSLARMAVGSIVLITLTSLPAFFVDVGAWLKALVALGVIWTIAAVVLTFSSNGFGPDELD